MKLILIPTRLSKRSGRICYSVVRRAAVLKRGDFELAGESDLGLKEEGFGNPK
jgi:hypothetical protein